MRKFFLLIAAAMLPAAGAFAEQPSRGPKSGNAEPSGKLLPFKGATSANSCAAFGAGFAMVEGTHTCVKIDGAVSSGASAKMGAR